MERTIVYRAQNLALGYKLSRNRYKEVCRELNFELRSGELTALLGANGTGKSTLIKTLCGFIPPLCGDVTLDGKNIKEYSKKVLSKKIGVVLTERNSEGGLTVSEMVGLGRYPYTGFFGTLNKEDNEVVERSMKSVGIYSMADRYVSELSDGERSKVMIAKTLAQECPVVILDEPTAFLDLKSKVEITSILHSLAVNENKAVLISTHDLELSLQLADRLWLMSEEQPFTQGATEDLILQGKLNNIFGNNNNSVEFDSSVGMFKSVKPSEKMVFVDGQSEPSFWVKNAIIRNGFMPTEDKCAVKISAHGKYSFAIEYEGVKETYCSVEGVVEGLKNI